MNNANSESSIRKLFRAASTVVCAVVGGYIGYKTGHFLGYYGSFIEHPMMNYATNAGVAAWHAIEGGIGVGILGTVGGGFLGNGLVKRKFLNNTPKA